MKKPLVLTALLAMLSTSVADAGPSSAREDWISSSALLTVRAGRTWDFGTVSFPACPSGQKFLVTHLSVIPRPQTGQLGFFPELKWTGFVAVRQFGSTPQGANPIFRLGVAGLGVQHQQIDLPGGQPTPGVAYPNGQIAYNDAAIQVDIETAMPSDLQFMFHVSGSCGTYHTQSSPSTTSSTQQTTRAP